MPRRRPSSTRPTREWDFWAIPATSTMGGQFPSVSAISGPPCAYSPLRISSSCLILLMISFSSDLSITWSGFLAFPLLFYSFYLCLRFCVDWEDFDSLNYCWVVFSEMNVLQCDCFCVQFISFGMNAPECDCFCIYNLVFVGMNARKWDWFCYHFSFFWKWMQWNVIAFVCIAMDLYFFPFCLCFYIATFRRKVDAFELNFTSKSCVSFSKWCLHFWVPSMPIWNWWIDLANICIILSGDIARACAIN